MTLSEKDGQLFYKLWLPLLDYVNEKRKVNKKVKNMANSESLNPQEVKEIANVLWDEVSLLISIWLNRGWTCQMNTKRLYPVGRNVFICTNAIVDGSKEKWYCN